MSSLKYIGQLDKNTEKETFVGADAGSLNRIADLGRVENPGRTCEGHGWMVMLPWTFWGGLCSGRRWGGHVAEGGEESKPPRTRRRR